MSTGNELVKLDDLATVFATKQDTLTFDATPTASSANPVTSGGLYKTFEQRARGTILGMRIDTTADMDPSEAVTYLKDCAGFTPARMDYTNDVFRWGSWRNAFFLPRPCMVKYDGTVDYYLDPNDYSKKADGTASDVADDTYGGNAMMEWGRDGQIWYWIVPDADDSSAFCVYFANEAAHSGFRAWSFVNSDGVMVEHFYTPIYNGSIDANGRLRSISGKANTALCQGKTPAEEIAAAELNNPEGMSIWYTEVYADAMLVNLLLALLCKSLDTQTAFGRGRTGQTASASSMLGTGTMDAKGLFWGEATGAYGVKVFGMENWWGNQWRRYAGHVMNDYVQRYKLTRGTQDGSTASDYVVSTSAADYAGYLTGATGPSTNGYVKRMTAAGYAIQVSDSGGTSSTCWTDYYYQSSGLRYALRGGACNHTVEAGAFDTALHNAPDVAYWALGASLSCKPAAT